MTGSTYRPEIDGLRAIAVLAVVFYHAGIGPATGYAGVDMFFVISGYLITWLLVQERREQGRIDLLAFYARRVRRILPAAALVIVTTVALAFLLLSGPEQQQVCQSAMAGLLFVANLFFLHHSGGYFDHPSAELPLLHLWSLAVEEQFYLLWPLVLMGLARLKTWQALACGILLASASFVFAEYLIGSTPEAAFYLMPARLWELAVGGLLALRPVQARAFPLLAPAAMAVVLGGLAVPVGHFPGLGALPVVAGTAFLIGMVHAGSGLGALGKVLRLAPVNYLGRISYSLYLWHWPLLALYHATSVGAGVAMPLGLCALSLLLAALTYRYVETPCRRLPVALARSRIVILGGVFSIGMSLALGALGRLTVATPQAASALSPQTDLATLVENDHMPNPPACSISAIAPPDQFPDPACASRPNIAPKVAVLGDSYADSWQALGWAIGQKRDLSAIDYFRSGCPVFLSRFGQDRSIRDTICSNYNARLVARVAGFDSIVIAVRWDARALAVDEEGLRSTLAALAPAVRKIYVLGPSPVLPERVPKCIRANRIDACTISRKAFEETAAPARAMLVSLTQRYPNVEYVELGDFLCTQDSCPAIKDGVVLYADQNHVTYSAAKKFAAGFVQAMK